jgi:septum formation protein
MPSLPPPLILASTSRYRRELLSRLRLPFTVEAPGVDETPGPAEPPAALARRLALEKARAVASRHPNSVVIGSDQVADLAGQPLVFQTALAVVRHDIGHESVDLASVTVSFRTLNDAEIEAYLRLDEPYDCAGSARSESLGVTLLSAIESDDPTALIGLPLIRTGAMLRAVGLDPLAPQAASRP